MSPSHVIRMLTNAAPWDDPHVLYLFETQGNWSKLPKAPWYGVNTKVPRYIILLLLQPDIPSFGYLPHACLLQTERNTQAIGRGSSG
jgi:hypothetical protein